MPENLAALAESDWRLILRRVKDERCVPFLGAGASVGSATHSGMPSGSTLAAHLARECDYPGRDTADLLRVAQYYTMVSDAYEVRASIRRRLVAQDVEPGPVHRAIAELPFAYVVTTNFDELMEQAFRDAGKAPRVVIYESHGNRQRIDAPTPDAPLIYKLHGCVSKPHTMIVTEDDVIEFLACLLLGDPDLPPLVKGLFEHFSILFIGYGLKDWNIRVMLRALRGRRISANTELSCFAIQRRPDDPTLAAEWEKAVMYWSKRESLRCFDTDACEFVAELRSRFLAYVQQ